MADLLAVLGTALLFAILTAVLRGTERL